MTREEQIVLCLASLIDSVTPPDGKPSLTNVMGMKVSELIAAFAPNGLRFTFVVVPPTMTPLKLDLTKIPQINLPSLAAKQVTGYVIVGIGPWSDNPGSRKYVGPNSTIGPNWASDKKDAVVWPELPDAHKEFERLKLRHENGDYRNGIEKYQDQPDEPVKTERWLVCCRNDHPGATGEKFYLCEGREPWSLVKDNAWTFASEQEAKMRMLQIKLPRYYAVWLVKYKEA